MNHTIWTNEHGQLMKIDRMSYHEARNTVKRVDRQMCSIRMQLGVHLSPAEIDALLDRLSALQKHRANLVIRALQDPWPFPRVRDAALNLLGR